MKTAIVIVLGTASIFALCLSILSSVVGSRGDKKDAVKELCIAIVCAGTAILTAWLV